MSQNFSRTVSSGLQIISLQVLLLFCTVYYAYAERPHAPTIIEFGRGGCTPTAEICGDGVDQDCNGSDSSCDFPIGSGPDGDMDGYLSSVDCDDSNKHIHGGVSVACSAECGSGWKTCQNSGSYSGCTCTPLCEATGSGRCFYISKLTGNDANPGTHSQPWKSVAPIFQFQCSGEWPGCDGDVRPAGIASHTPGPGDVIYLMSGVYKETWKVEGKRYGLFLRESRGTATNPVQIKAYPGANPVILPETQAIGMMILQSSHVHVEGIEVARANGAGVFVAESQQLKFANMKIHSTDGVDNHNIAGFYAVDINGLELRHSVIHDNYDRTNADTNGNKTENSRNVVLFSGGNARIHHNTIFQTPPTSAQKTGACVVQKHGLTVPGGILEVDHNIFKNCYFAAIGTSSYGGRFHHNLIFDSDESISVRNHGGPPIFVDNIAEYNTMVNTPGLLFEPSNAYEIGGQVGLMKFRYNIIADNHDYNPDNGGAHRIDPYGSQSVLDWLLANGDLQIQSNCYYNSREAVKFAYFSYAPGGGFYDFEQWKAKGFDTSGSFVTDPQLDEHFAPQNSSCKNYGHLAGW